MAVNMIRPIAGRSTCSCSSLLRPTASMRSMGRASFVRNQSTFISAVNSRGPTSRALMLAPPRAIRAYRQPYATMSRTDIDHAHKAAELEHGKDKLESNPAAVSSDSSLVSPMYKGEGSSRDDDDVDMLAGIKSDLRTIKATFALGDVPKEAYYIGLAGVLPYLATSVSTYYLAWDIDYAHSTGQGFLLSGQTAEALLHFIEPLQVGYGAVIISFLGAIHWGLEFAGYGGHHHYRRYAVGVVAPAIAWPTILFPVEYALITQFLTFNFLYFTDARATANGWFPSWYGSYRYVLTFIVGASIVVSLIGRGKIADKVGKSHGPADHLKALREVQRQHLEQEEEEERRRRAEEEDEDDE